VAALQLEHAPLAMKPCFMLPQAGLDSLAAVELRDAVSRSLGVALPATVVFDYPTVTALAAYITDQLPLARHEGFESPPQEASLPHTALFAFTRFHKSAANELESLHLKSSPVVRTLSCLHSAETTDRSMIELYSEDASSCTPAFMQCLVPTSLSAVSPKYPVGLQSR
jgi:hypothetical protein